MSSSVGGTRQNDPQKMELLADSNYFGTFLDFVIFNLLPLLGGGGICLVLCFLFEFSLLGRFLALGI